jgi:trans-aconitate 2-methyltransferase
MSSGGNDWNPGAYSRFRGLRLRPALDLLMQVPAAGPTGDVVDLGCGDGAAAPALRMRFPERRIIGVDGSAAMLAKARGYDQTLLADVAVWAPDSPPALLFSNAVLHWLPDHTTLLPRLAGLLSPGGTLAVQMPRQYLAPSHALLRDLAAKMFPDRFDFAGWVPPVVDPQTYLRLLVTLGQVDVWETDYLQRLDPVPEGHPVRAFTASTAMRPFLDKLTAAEAGAFTAAYDSALGTAYPPEPDGSVLFPFRRLFIILTVH